MMTGGNVSMGGLDNETVNFNRFRFEEDQAMQLNLNLQDSKLGNLKQKFKTIDHESKNALKAVEEPMCRICLSEDEPDNPIISPCKCTGSVKYIHLSCI